MEVYRIVTRLDELRELLQGLLPIAFDYETAPDAEFRNEPKAALDAHKSHIVGFSFSVKEGVAYYVPLAHWYGFNVEDPNRAWTIFKERVLLNTQRVKIAHNLAFEAMFTYGRDGTVIQPPCYDTMLGGMLTLKEKQIFRKMHDCGLKKMATHFFHVEMPSFETVTNGRHFDEMNPADWETTRYACADSDYTLRLYYKMNGWFDNVMPGHRYICEQVESPAAVYVGMMKYNGILMDVPLMEEKGEVCEYESEHYKSIIDEITGGVSIGANASTKAFKDYLYKTEKLPIVKRTDKGQPATDDEAMILLKESCEDYRPELCPLFDAVREFRKWNKLKSTYVDGYLCYVNSVTGRIHPDLMQMKAETGRFACEKPNCQNPPAVGMDPIKSRNFMIAPEGYQLLECDYSQAEIRIAAYLAQDQVLLDAYRHGEDVHAITTSAVFNIPLSEAKDKSRPDYKHRRTVAKSTLFGIMYGIAGAGLSRNLHTNAGVVTTPEQCNDYIRGILGKYRGLAAWQKQMKRFAYDHMYVETALGRRRYLPNIRSKEGGWRNSSERMAINTPVQGLGADLLKLAMGRLIAALKDRPYIRPILTVHDSLVFEVREDKLDEAIKLVRECMETPPDLPNFMPLVAEAAYGKRYGELKE